MPAAGSPVAAGNGPFSVVAADLNGDGRPDLAVANSGSNNVTILLNAADTTPPVITVPATGSFQATSLAGATATYSASALDDVDGSVAVSCFPVSGSIFPIGTTTVNCSASDTHGNTSLASFPVQVSVVAVTATPPPLASVQTASFAWTSLIPFTTFTCSLDGAVPARCSSPRTYRGLAAGGHTLCVQAIADVQPQCRSWTVVSPGKPVVSISSTSVVGSDATVSFTSDQTAPRFTCSLDGAAYKSCSSPLTYHGLAVGSHTVRVLATNFAGDTSASPASTTFAIT